MCKSEPVETIEKDDFIIEIYPDDVADNPRDWDNLGTMACFHNRYNLGDKHEFCNEINPFANEDADYSIYYDDDPRGLVKFIQRGDVISLPLYLYDHSMQSMKTTPFFGWQHAEWDSGQVGYIYVTREQLLKEYGWKRLTKARIEKAKHHLEGEVKSYDYYLRGDVYGYNAVCKKCGEVIDSCWGFYGHDHENSGLLEQAKYAECEDCKATEQRLSECCQLELGLEVSNGY